MEIRAPARRESPGHEEHLDYAKARRIGVSSPRGWGPAASEEKSSAGQAAGAAEGAEAIRAEDMEIRAA